MLDIKFIRENLKDVENMLKVRRVGLDLSHLIEIDDERRKLIREVDVLRGDKKKAAEKRDVEKGKQIKKELSKKEDSLALIEREFEEEMYKIPNLVLPGVPIGDESANSVLVKVGEPPKFDFEPKDHVQLGEALDIIDLSRAAKVAGSRHSYLKNDAVLLEFTLVQWVLRTLVKEGFIPVVPPVLINKEITDGLGYWQAGGNENFYLVHDYEVGSSQKEKELSKYLIGTGEHSVVPIHKDEILEEKELPKRYIAFSPCFRREAGSYGKDVKGIFRVHQFDKLEMVSFVKPENDESERSWLLSIAESFMQALELPYQVVKLASGDLPFPTAETIDIETWIPSQKRYRETHSISTTTDFQSRRFGIKYRKGNQSEHVHILNATAIAMPRTIITILENHQQKDGSVKVPKVLHEYMGKDTLQRS